MKNTKNKVTTAIVILATFILAGVAIFTAVRLYQLRQQPVAPNVPSSIPRAQEVPSCSLTFTLTATPGTVGCTSKKAYIAANNTSSITDKTQDFALGSEISSGGSVSPGQEIIYVISIDENDSGLDYTTTDIVDSKLEYINYQSTDECSVNSTTKTVTCSGTDSGRANVQVKIKAKVKAASTGSLANVANVTVGEEAPVSCNISLNISTQTSSPTPTPTPTPGTPGPTATPNACNGTCGSNFNCGPDLVCYNGFCRNPSCTSVANCVCGTSAPAATPVAPSLPESGTDWPTILGAGVGILVILGSLLLAL